MKISYILKAYLSFAVLLSSATVYSSDQQIPQYTQAPKFYEFLPNALSDIPDMALNLNPANNWEATAWIFASTGIMIYYDQPIIDETQRFSRRIGLIDEGDVGGGSRLVWSKNIAGIGADFWLPDSANSYMYYIGDGVTSLSIAAGLLTFGAINTDYRALNATSQLMESLVLTGSFVLTSKYTFGRQSPFQATQDGGLWRPMPPPRKYMANVSKYDAYPSGHVATVMATTTILSLNYPEKSWIVPVGYTGLGLLMYAMLNNGVHWASDYPLGITYGYIAAHTVFEKRKPKSHTEVVKRSRHPGVDYSLTPLFMAGTQGLELTIKM